MISHFGGTIPHHIRDFSPPLKKGPLPKHSRTTVSRSSFISRHPSRISFARQYLYRMDGHDGQEAQQQPASDDSNIGAAEVVLSSDESGTVPEEKVTHPEFNAPKSQALYRVSKPREILARNRKSLWAVLGVIVILLAVIVGLWVRVVIKHPTGSSRYFAFFGFRTEGRVNKQGDTSTNSTLT